MDKNHTFKSAKFYYILILLVTFSQSCGKSDAEETPPPLSAYTPTFLDIRDIANQGNATDFEISFSKPDNTDHIEEYRVLLVKGSRNTTLEINDALNVPSGNYFVLDPFSSSEKINLGSTFKDIEGDLVQNDVKYHFYVLVIAKQESQIENFLSRASLDITLERKSAVRTLTTNINAGSGGMDVDDEGNIYMGDFGKTLSAGGTTVYKITPEGVVSTFVTGMRGASGNDFDSEGNLFQSSTAGYISKVTPDKQVSTFVSGISGGLIGVSVNNDGSMFVCNCGRNQIHEITANGEESIYVSNSLLSCPNGIDKDSSGNLYIANFNNGNIIKITPDKEVSLLATVPGNNNGHLLINGGTIFVVARGANSIYTVSLSGNVTLFAGSGRRGLENGSLERATFSLPNDIAFSPDGKKMYVNDVAGTSSNASLISPVVIREIELIF